MVATDTHPRRPWAGITFPHKRWRWRVGEDARSRRSCSLDVVDVVVHLTITRSCTRRHKWQRPRARSHVQLDIDSSTPSVQRGSGRRDPPDTPPHTSPSGWTTNYNSGRASLSQDGKWAATMQGREDQEVCVQGRERGGLYRGGGQPRGGRPKGLLPLHCPLFIPFYGDYSLINMR